MLDEELRQDDLVGPQRVVPILPVKHQVVLIVRICGEREVFTVTVSAGEMGAATRDSQSLGFQKFIKRKCEKPL